MSDKDDRELLKEERDLLEAICTALERMALAQEHQLEVIIDNGKRLEGILKAHEHYIKKGMGVRKLPPPDYKKQLRQRA